MKNTKYKGPSPEEKLVIELIDLMEKGKNPWRRDWDQVNNGKHINFITGHAYRGVNPAFLNMYLMARDYKYPFWCGTAQARSKNWFPKKGSRGCYIMKPLLLSSEVKDKVDEKGDPVLRSWMTYRPACIFNVQDLDGDGLEEAIAEKADIKTESKSEPDRLKDCELVLYDYHKRENLETLWSGDQAFYDLTKDRITMPERQQFHNSCGLYATWIHECVHSTGHKNRLSRNLSGAKGSNSYAKEELVAELGAFLICNRLEISSDTQNHAAYLQSWINCLKAEPTILFKTMAAATRATNLICEEEESTPQPQQSRTSCHDKLASVAD